MPGIEGGFALVDEGPPKALEAPNSPPPLLGAEALFGLPNRLLVFALVIPKGPPLPC